MNFGLPIFNYHNEIFKITKSMKSSEPNFLTLFFITDLPYFGGKKTEISGIRTYFDKYS